MRRSRRLLLIGGAVVTLAVGAVAVVALAGGFDRATTRERVGGGGTKVVRVALVDASLGLDVKPNMLVVDRGTHLILDVVNDGNETHDLAVEGGPSRTRMLDPGATSRPTPRERPPA